MSVIVQDESFRAIETVHLYAERAMNAKFSVAGQVVADIVEPTERELDAIMHLNILVSAQVCASEEGADPRNGVEQIADERYRQIDRFSEDHDDAHHRGELAYAAVVLAFPPLERLGREDLLADFWPWLDLPNHNGDRKRELVKAGALIAAEIDRLDRDEG